MEQRSLFYGDKVIYYSRECHRIDSERLLIKVHDDGRVVAHAPLSASEEMIKAAMTKRARWIWKQLEQIHQYLERMAPRQYVSGESYFYLGRRHLLKIVVEKTAKPEVKLLRGKFQVMTQALNNEAAVKKLLNYWYQSRAEDVFQKRLHELLPKTPWVKTVPKVRLQRMSKQWGSCSANHVLTLNTHLVKAPRDCIDYVILHELCHISEHNHSEHFYRLLHATMPNWEVHKTYLDRHVYCFIDSKVRL